MTGSTVEGPATSRAKGPDAAGFRESKFVNASSASLVLAVAVACHCLPGSTLSDIALPLRCR